MTKKHQKKKQTEKLIKLLDEGERSGYIKDFNPQKFLDQLHKKYVKKQTESS